MNYGPAASVALPTTGVALGGNILLAITLMVVGVILWQLVPRFAKIRRNKG
jgi:hypothetical protein